MIIFRRKVFVTKVCVVSENIPLGTIFVNKKCCFFYVSTKRVFIYNNCNGPEIQFSSWFSPKISQSIKKLIKYNIQRGKE